VDVNDFISLQIQIFPSLIFNQFFSVKEEPEMIKDISRVVLVSHLEMEKDTSKKDKNLEIWFYHGKHLDYKIAF
jgi:hypothetical protein